MKLLSHSKTRNHYSAVDVVVAAVASATENCNRCADCCKEIFLVKEYELR